MILASASPRRRELLEEEGFDLELCPADIDETPMAGEFPVAYVERLAREKARAACEARGGLAAGERLLAADTIVWMDASGSDGADGSEGGSADGGSADGGGAAVPELLGKPADAEDAARMLRVLSGCWHHVTTGVCMLVGVGEGAAPRETCFSETTDVEFFDLTEDDIAWYLATGEPYDKAGAYGIQGRGRRLVKGICGDFYTVIGLPVPRLLYELAHSEN